MIDKFPHCDTRVLHAPGECRYCDKHPEWQDLREAWGIAFTGHTPKVDPDYPWRSEQPCPADASRGRGGAHVWPGNQPRPLDERDVARLFDVPAELVDPTAPVSRQGQGKRIWNKLVEAWNAVDWHASK